MTVYPTCNVPIQTAEAVATRIRQAVAQRAPFSLIRSGDGEGVVLWFDRDPDLYDCVYLTEHFGSFGVSLQNIRVLSQMLQQALVNADVLGVRSDICDVDFPDDFFQHPPQVFLNAFRQRFRLRAVEKNIDYPPARRIASYHRVLKTLDFAAHTQFCDAWIHMDLQAGGHLAEILRNETHIGWVGGRHECIPKLKQVFGVEVTAFDVPDKFIQQSPQQHGVNFPMRFAQLQQQLAVAFPGQVFIVAAGLCGKVYCDWIKQRGGIALDVGAVADSWIGRASRPMVYAQKFGTKGTVPEQLLLK